METSDSENFESADEDLQSSDDETVQSIKECKQVQKTNDGIVEQVEKLSSLKVTDKKSIDLDSFTDNKEILVKKLEIQSVQKDGETGVSSRVTDKKLVDLDDFNDNKQVSVETQIVEKDKTPVDVKKSRENKETQIVEKDAETAVDVKKSREKKETRKKLGEKVSKTTVYLNENPPKQTGTVFESGDVNQSPIKNSIEENLWDESEINWEQSEENMWENDNWENIDEIPQQTKQQNQHESNSSTWGSWGNWGVSSLLTTATQGVTTITQSLSTVLETGIGVPDPEELARLNKTEQETDDRQIYEKTEENSAFGLENLVMGVSQLTKLVETTGTKVITGGLDTLETIGKKTMEVLQEGDPGLKKKRAFLRIDQDKPVLSQILREAKEKSEQEQQSQYKFYEKKSKNYETLFDDHQGLVHLEALEMLSRQCDIKLQTLLETLTGDQLTEMQETMDQIKELCELPDEDDDEQISFNEIQDKLQSAIDEINIAINYKKLVETWQETGEWLNNLKLEICDEHELHQQSIETLAQLTAMAVEQFHKAGELLLVKEHRSTADEADSLVQLTTTLVTLIGIVANRFTDKLNAKHSNCNNKEELNSLITNVFFEAANSSSYIQDAFQLLIPVLQVGAV